MGFAYDDVDDAFDEDYKYDKEYLKREFKGEVTDEHIVDDYNHVDEDDENDDGADTQLPNLLEDNLKITDTSESHKTKVTTEETKTKSSE